MKQPVAITGFASISAAGSNNANIWHSLTNSVRNLSNSQILHKDALPYPFLAAPCFDAENRKKSAKDTLFLALHAVENAILDAKLSEEILKEAKTAVVMGTTAGSALHFIDTYEIARKHAFTNEAEYLAEKSTTNTIDAEEYFKANLALEIGNKLQVSGPCLTLANACTSGADAIGIGMELIRANECDFVICGGADALSLVPHTGFARLMVYDKEACKPFDGNRKGLNLGEAAAVIILESAEHAKKRQTEIKGFAVGYGSGSDAHHFTAPHPDAFGLNEAMKSALLDAGITKEDLAFVNAHGTATKENDNVEGKFFNTHLAGLPVWASKAITGHTLGAAGALEAIFSLMALQNNTLPLSAGFNEVDPNINLIPTRENTAIEKEYALSTSLGFGGGNAALIVSTDKKFYQ